MGKRELLLIAAFLVIGVIAYRVTAPPDQSGGGFSIGKLIETIRSELRGQNYELQATQNATAAAPPSLTTLRIDDFRGSVVVTGEDESDVSVELHLSVFGADEAQARQFRQAMSLALEPEPDGHTLDVRIRLQVGEMRRRPRTQLLVKVPKRLGLRLASNGGELGIAHVSSVKFDRGSGKAMLSDVAGAVSGAFGSGSLEVDQAGSIEMETRRTEVRLTNIAGAVKLEGQSGNIRVRSVRGPAELSLERLDAEVEDVLGALKVEGRGGELRIRNPRGVVTARVERMGITLVLSVPVAVDASTTGDTLDVTLPTGGLSLQAVANNGRIRASHSAIAVTTAGEVQRTTATLHGGGPLIKLESTRGDIVIR